MGLGVAPEALPSVLVSASRGYVGPSAVVGETATAVGAGTCGVGVAGHGDLLRSVARAPFAPSLLIG